MARVDLVEPFAIRSARKCVRESLMAHGEEVIALKMYHPFPDEGVQPRCPNCYDDVYKAGEKFDCTVCYGTTFQGGVKELSRMWAMFTNNTDDEQINKRGVWQSTNRQVQMEANPGLWENDYLIRVRRWSQDHKPLDFADAYVLGGVTEETLRTGNQFVQDNNDRVGQRTKADGLTPDHVIYKVIGRLVSPDFPVLRTDGLSR